jgi:TonB family protein
MVLAISEMIVTEVCGVRTLAILTLTTLLLGACAHHEEIQVSHIAQPEYPADARYKNIQGTVQIEVSIGVDGKVISATGNGDFPILVEAAKNNASQWQFGPLPVRAEFPMHHTITYVYSLTGKPIFVAIRPTVRTFLPDRIEIVATPLASDYPLSDAYKPLNP